MSIIDKLGITPGPWNSTEIKANKYCDITSGSIDSKYSIFCAQYVPIENAELIAAAPEMLEALINTLLGIEVMAITHTVKAGYGKYVNRDKLESIIEKATGKSWEEIKALID